MKATIEVPDDLYRLVKAKSALEGRAVRAVAVELFQRYVEEGLEPGIAAHAAIEDEPAPEWFGALRRTAKQVARHDMGAIRESVARGIVEERKL